MDSADIWLKEKWVVVEEGEIRNADSYHVIGNNFHALTLNCDS
jgi:hypothetical protein